MQKKSSVTSIKHTRTPYIFYSTNSLIQASQSYKQTKNRHNNFKYINPSFPYLERG